MLTANNIMQQINTLTADIIKSGLCQKENFPSMKPKKNNIVEIGISNPEHSIFLKNIPYSEMYMELVKKEQYNLKMIDGALITLLYRFKGKNLISHRLSFFPAPNLEIFQNEPYMYINDELYTELTNNKKIVTVPLRFDFDSSEDVFIPIKHPRSHFTLGQYENCRIPVSSAISPYQFLKFIIDNFYYFSKSKLSYYLTPYNDKFISSIVDEEKKLIHICTPI